MYQPERRLGESKTPVQTVRADFPHTAYQVVVQGAALCGPRILNGPAQAAETQGFEEGTTPAIGPTRVETTSRSCDEQGVEPFLDVAVHLDKLRRRTPAPKPNAPTPQKANSFRA